MVGREKKQKVPAWGSLPAKKAMRSTAFPARGYACDRISRATARCCNGCRIRMASLRHHAEEKNIRLFLGWAVSGAILAPVKRGLSACTVPHHLL